jgi:hypothetical protein
MRGNEVGGMGFVGVLRWLAHFSKSHTENWWVMTRLYSVARIRGLGFDTRFSSKSLSNDKGFILRAV